MKRRIEERIDELELRLADAKENEDKEAVSKLNEKLYKLYDKLNK